MFKLLIILIAFVFTSFWLGLNSIESERDRCIDALSQGKASIVCKVHIK